MMAAPGEFGTSDLEPYEVTRGACPRCGGTEVRHLIIGLPAGPEDMESTPEWIDWVGCVHPGFNRECESCQLTWTFDGSNTPLS